MEKERAHQELTRLENEFQELKTRRLILKKQGLISESREIKARLEDNIRERERIYWGDL